MCFQKKPTTHCLTALPEARCSRALLGSWVTAHHHHLTFCGTHMLKPRHSLAVPMETATMLSFNCTINGCPPCDGAPNISDLKWLIKPPQLWFHACVSVQRVAMEHPVGLGFSNGRKHSAGHALHSTAALTGPLHVISSFDLAGSAWKCREAWDLTETWWFSSPFVSVLLFSGSDYLCSSFISSCYHIVTVGAK